MRTIVIIIVLLLNIFTGHSQSLEKSSRSFGIGLSYRGSFIAREGTTLLNSSSIAPYGIGIHFNFNFHNRITSDLGTALVITDQNIYDTRGLIIYDGQSEQIYKEWRDIYFSIPVHIKYCVLNRNYFQLLFSSGPELLINNQRYYYDPDRDGQTYDGSDISLGIGLELGLIETIRIANNFGIVLSQYYGRLSFGELKGTESFDVRLGITYMFKK